MKIVIPGGSGELGKVLAKAFVLRGFEVVILSRESNHKGAGTMRFVGWDGETEGAWISEIDGADAVINLAGRSVNCRYTAANRAEITRSRVRSTELVGEAIGKAKKPPPTWLQMSTATIYAHSFDKANDEATGTIGGDEPNAPDTWRFSIEVVKAWEQAMDNAAISPKVRKIKMRSSIVMSPYENGPFDILSRLVRSGLGGKAGSGKQYMSWITDADFVNAVLFLIENPNIEGPVNLATPNPLPNEEFMRTLRMAWGKGFGLSATEWMIELAALLIKTESELILKSRRVVPKKLLDARFQFDYPDWELAASDLVQRWLQNHKVRNS